MGEPPGWSPDEDPAATLARRTGSEQFRAYTRRRGEQRAEQQIEAEDKASRPPMVIRDGSWLNAYQPPPITWAVPQLIPEGMALVAGSVKMGKSWLVLGICLTLASGAQPLGTLEPGPVRPVLYLALEDSDRRMKERCAELGYAMVPEAFSYTTECQREAVTDEIWAWLVRWRGWRPVVIVDTWGKVVSPTMRGETTYERDYRLSGQVATMVKAEPGSSVIINAHTRKQGAEDWVEMISGTLGISGGADTLMLLARKRGASEATLHVTGRDVEEADYALDGFPRWAMAGGSMAAAATMAERMAQTSRLSDRSVAILDFVNAAGRPVMTAEVALAVGITTDSASTYLGRLNKSGSVLKLERGKWMSVYGGGGPNGDGHGSYNWRQMYADADHDV